MTLRDVSGGRLRQLPTGEQQPGAGAAALLEVQRFLRVAAASREDLPGVLGAAAPLTREVLWGGVGGGST